MMNRRRPGAPVSVLTDATTAKSRAINALHVQTCITDPRSGGTFITFASGDNVTVKEAFDEVVEAFLSDILAG
jgi:uncharacterized protein YlzI (FlbEa/FlbD family)